MARADWVANVFRTSIDLRRELAGRLPGQGQAADDLVLAEQGHGEERPVAEPDERVPDAALVGPGLGDVGDLDGLAHLGRAPHEPFALPERRRPQGLDERRVVVVRWRAARTARRRRRTRRSSSRRAPASWLARETMVSSTVSTSSVELTARLTSPSAVQLLDRLGQLARPRLQLLEEADVLDGDDGLVGEGLEQRDLPVGERPTLLPARR